MIAASTLPNPFTIFDEDGNQMWEVDGECFDHLLEVIEAD